MDLFNVINNELQKKQGIWYSGSSGCWSLLEESENQELLAGLSKYGCRNTIKKLFPQWEDLIFSLKRPAGVGMLDIRRDDIVVDFGCMWGALTVPIARTNCQVIGVDQNSGSLFFLKRRLEEEGLKNVELVCAEASQITFRRESIDKIILNGVLEWIPEPNNVALGRNGPGKNNNRNPLSRTYKYYKSGKSPKEMQLQCLQKLNKALKRDGVLYLAIENRFDIGFFFGLRDPHTGLRFVDVLPRCLQTLYSFIFSGRPHLAWIYSEKELKYLLHLAGFSRLEVSYAFPSYQFPEQILSPAGIKLFQPLRYTKSNKKLNKIFWWLLENLVYKTLRLKSLSPAFIVIAYK